MPTVFHVPANGSLQQTIDSIGAESDVRIELDHGSKADIVIRLIDASVVRHTATVIVGPEARCTVLTINASGSSNPITISQSGSIEAGGSLRWQNVTLAPDVTHDLTSRAVGANAESAIDWMFYGKGNEKQVLTVRNIFDAPNGSGEILMKGVAEGMAHSSAKGMIDIGLKGNGTNTYLTQQVLMLDPTAKVDAVPGLEIKTNDVKASHSATVARVTPEDLFYFAARGISTTEARAMFVQGFLGEIIDRIVSEKMRSDVVEIVAKKYEMLIS